jgi:hypothetical protein
VAPHAAAARPPPPHHGTIANARAGKPDPPSGFGHVATMIASFGGT